MKSQKSPIHKNSPTRFNDKLPSFVLTSPWGRWCIDETRCRVHVYTWFLILHKLCASAGVYIDYNYTFFSFYAVQKNVNTLHTQYSRNMENYVNPLNPELNPICYLLALLGAHHFLHVSSIRVKLVTFRRLMSYIYGAPILFVSRSHTTTQHSR